MCPTPTHPPAVKIKCVFRVIEKLYEQNLKESTETKATRRDYFLAILF